MKSGIQAPFAAAFFDNPILKMSIGCGFVGVIDTSYWVYLWGDNFAGQLGQGDDIHRSKPVYMKQLLMHNMIDISCGLQHCLFLTDQGEVFGSGKNNKY